MNIQLIKWDTEFFGMKIARITSKVEDKKHFMDLLQEAKLNEISLIYCFADPNDFVANSVYLEFGKLVDEKVTFYQKIENKTYKLDSGVELYEDNIVTDELVQLAYQSGEYSRFRIDSNFPKGCFEKLYTKWVENAVNKKYDDAVYVYKLNNKIVGLLTLKDKENAGTISLIGVDQSVRGQNIGSKLVNATFYHYSQKNVFNIEVVTQKANQLACKFYEKNGFVIKNIVNIYHIWL